MTQRTLQEQIIFDRNKGMSNVDIAKKHNISEADIRAVIRHNEESPLDSLPEKEVDIVKTETKKTIKKPIRPNYYIDKSGKHRWRLKSRNGEVFGASHQGFTTKQEAQKNFARNRRLEE